MKPLLRFSFFSVLFLAALSMLSADESSRRGVKNLEQPWVFRTVLDARPRVLVAALDDGLWAAWDTQRCRLFQVWKPGAEGVKLQGAAFDGAHGPQPVSDGSRLHQEPAEAAWFLPGQGEPKVAEVRYRSHRTGKPGELTLTYAVQLGEGSGMAVIEETPSVVVGDGAVLTRKFSVSGLPAGKQLALRLEGARSLWSVAGDAGEWKSVGDALYVVIRKNGEFTLVGSWKGE